MTFPAYYNEFDPFAAAWLRELVKADLIAPGLVDERPIQEVSPDDVAGFAQCHFFAGIGGWSYALRLAGWPDDLPVWTGSCPCQPFSAAGKRRGTADERHLWPVWHGLIREHRPPTLFGEQVAGPAGLLWFEAVSADLEAAGYAVGAADLGAASVGAPHIRQRLYFVADADRDGRPLVETPRLHGRWSPSGGSDPEASCPDRTSGHDASGCRSGGRGRLGSPNRPRLEGHAGHGGRSSGRARSAGSTGAAGRPGNPWERAEWISCRDGKRRPVEPKYVKVADGIPGGVVSVCDSRHAEETTEDMNATATEADSTQELRRLRQNATEETVRLGNTGRLRDVHASSLLQPELHGGLDGRPDEGVFAEKQQASVSEGREVVVRGVRQEQHEAIRPSPGRESNEQRHDEFEDFVRLLPSSVALAELCGDRPTAEALRALCRSVNAERLLLHPSDQIQEAWRSLGKDVQDRFKLEAGKGGFVRTYESPLAGSPSRIGRLRGYGNAIVPPLAAEFIGAYMDLWGSFPSAAYDAWKTTPPPEPEDPDEEPPADEREWRDDGTVFDGDRPNDD